MTDFRIYALSSIALASAIIYWEVNSHQKFYTTVSSIATSKVCKLAILNLCVFLGISTLKIMNVVFLGRVNADEIESLSDRFWGTVMDTLLAMTIFKGTDLNASFFAMFGLLLAFKMFQWLCADRVEKLASMTNRFSDYVRLFSLMLLCLVVDLAFQYFTTRHVVFTEKPDYFMLFAFEYTLLSLSMIVLFIKFGLSVYDLTQGGMWDNKSVIILYLDFFVDVVQLIVYVVFFCTVLIHYALPIHLIRQMWYTYVSFHNRFKMVLRYSKVSREMDMRFPEVNVPVPEDEEDVPTCGVCLDELRTGRQLPCGHILHYQCLRRWLQESLTCPLCRKSVLYEDLNGQNGNQNNQNGNNRNLPGNNDLQLGLANNFVNNIQIDNNGMAPHNPHMDLNNNNNNNIADINTSNNQHRNVRENFVNENMDNDPDSLLSQVRLLQDQVDFISEQLGRLAHTLESNYTQLPEPIPRDNIPEPSNISTRTATTTTTTTTSPGPISYTDVTDPVEDIKDEPELVDNTETEDEQERMRKRRLLHFSSDGVGESN
eukprot:TRINITY_DN2038_c2_g2_i1.p1 TRINITY_DN2038_c2_g2~~TRINITY_DN2038_c2_g2_i1.p1  ORF type:complete len:542 (+),score=77.07 TRINITY_DN2038_c2_g2_i1:51-1676(+)